MIGREGGGDGRRQTQRRRRKAMTPIVAATPIAAKAPPAVFGKLVAKNPDGFLVHGGGPSPSPCPPFPRVTVGVPSSSAADDRSVGPGLGGGDDEPSHLPFFGANEKMRDDHIDEIGVLLSSPTGLDSGLRDEL